MNLNGETRNEISSVIIQPVPGITELMYRKNTMTVEEVSILRKIKGIAHFK